LPWRAAEARVGDLLERVRSDLGPDAVVETNNDLLGALHCPRCDRTEQLWTSLGKVTEPQARCPRCGADRTPRLVHLIDGKDPILDRSLLDIGIPPWDVVAGRSGMNQRFYELAGDREEVLGPEME